MKVIFTNMLVGICMAGVMAVTGCGYASVESGASSEDQKPQKPAAPTASEPAAVSGSASDGLRNLFGDALVDASKQTVSVNKLAGKKVGIYFSAHWCPPCRKFTPVLVNAYNGMQEADKDFGMVFVSSDRNEGAMYKYMTETDMPWLAVPYDSNLRQALGQKYGVRGIPTLVIVDENGELISKNARGDIVSKGTGAYDMW